MQFMPDDTAVLSAASRDVADAALAGLSKQPKTLPAKLFYDEAGCRLFARITELPEYYLTRTERALLNVVAPTVMASLAEPPVVLVEYGASDEEKANFLLREKDRLGSSVVQAYVPIDVATSALEQMRTRLHVERPELQVCIVAADFMEPMT